MKAKDREYLKETSQSMLAEAQFPDSDRIFSATGFARENISILHQQLRCANLAWALSYAKKVKRGDVVAIVGGSFSGLMLACSLAIADDVIVYIFEKEKRLLNRFLDKSHRHLSPNLNSRTLGEWFDPATSSPFYDSAIFEWEPGPASEVAHEWLTNFEKYRRTLPIFTFLECEVKPEDIQQQEQCIRICARPDAGRKQPVDVDILIDATGFGEEKNELDVTDYSYWESGHRLIYDHLPKNCSVLVSGCGDSGIIEAMHYAIKDFRHEMVEKFWRAHINLELILDEGVSRAELNDILMSAEVDKYGGRLISELCWWLDTWDLICSNRDLGFSFRKLGSGKQPIFQAIEKALKPHLSKAFPRRKLSQLEFHKLEAFLLDLDMESQVEIRKAVMPIIEECISRNIKKFLSELHDSSIPKLSELNMELRPGILVTFNGRTSTPYTRQMSTYNIWLTRILMSFTNVRYWQGEIKHVKPTASGFLVTFEDKLQKVYVRVVTRYGLTWPSLLKLPAKSIRDPHREHRLLTPVGYVVPIGQTHTGYEVKPPTDDVARKLKEIFRRRGSYHAQPVNKELYKRRLFLGPLLFPKNICDYWDNDPQKWLSSKLRSGTRPSYEEDFNPSDGENFMIRLKKCHPRGQKRK